MFDDALEIVIVGTAAAGRAFRPSDWAERLCGMMSVFSEDRHLSYSRHLKPVMSAGVCCVVVDVELARIDPQPYAFLFTFARDNELTVRPGRKVKRPEPEEAAPPSAAPAAGSVCC